MLVDTNVLLRALQPNHPHHVAATHALETLPGLGRELHVAPQNLIELWAVMTRPADANGLGWDVVVTRAVLDRLERLFAVLPETPALYPAWKRLVIEHGISGKPTHDARLAAVMQVYGLSAVLTFDRNGFTRFPGIEVVHPADVSATG